MTIRSRRVWLFGIGLMLLILHTSASAVVGIPALTQRVTDLTATLTSVQISMLEKKLAAFEASQGSQIAVLMLPTTQPEAISQFGIRLADAWKIGRQKVDDGVILIIAKDDRKLRLEVGYGLEGAISDAISKRIISEIITPYFKAGDFAGGIDAGITQITQLILGESLPPATQHNAKPEDDGQFMLILLGGLFVGWFLSALFGQILGGLIAALGSGIVAAVILGSGFSIMIGFMVFFIVGLHQSGRSGWTNHRRGGGRSSYRSGGSSYRGGGGGFGGGGASGSW